MTDDPRHPIYRRRRSLIIGLVAYLADQPTHVPWDLLVATFTAEKTSYKTVENTIRDLENFGALHRIGHPAAGRKEDTRALHATALGIAWLERELLDLPGQHHPDDVDDDDLDPFELADEIADHAALVAELEHDLHLEDPLAP